MVHSPEYKLFAADESALLGQAEAIYDCVWRVDFSMPGFCCINIPPAIGSRQLRLWMVLLKRRLSDVGQRRHRGGFGYLSMARFDQQVTTKFHLDGAPPQSLLMLGYEPSSIRSRFFLADYSQAAFDSGFPPERFLTDFNPMYRRGEEMLSSYVTELPQPLDGHSRIVLVNNSSLPFTTERINSLGVMHKAIIEDPDPTRSRIINSTMLVMGQGDEVPAEQQELFINTVEISRSSYAR